jgi:Holliday junction resolvase RusA-like endonuclease
MTGRSLSLDLTLPPSVNRCFANVAGKGRVRTSIYRRWQKAALAEIQAHARGITVRGTFRISIAASDQGLSRERDADNLAKAIADVLTKAGIIADDCHRHMRSIALAWTPDLPAGRCTVEVREISPAPLPKPAKASRRTRMPQISTHGALGDAKASAEGQCAGLQEMPATSQRRESGAVHPKCRAPRTRAKPAAVSSSIMKALRARGINAAPEKVRLQ